MKSKALTTGSVLADNYNSLDEDTEWDARMHSDFMTEHLGFFAVIGSGTWGSNGKTTYSHKDAGELQKKGRLDWPKQSQEFSLLGLREPVGVHDG